LGALATEKTVSIGSPFSSQILGIIGVK